MLRCEMRWWACEAFEELGKTTAEIGLYTGYSGSTPFTPRQRGCPTVVQPDLVPLERVRGADNGQPGLVPSSPSWGAQATSYIL